MAVTPSAVRVVSIAKGAKLASKSASATKASAVLPGNKRSNAIAQ
jgi:hypothetical protein